VWGRGVHFDEGGKRVFKGKGIEVKVILKDHEKGKKKRHKGYRLSYRETKISEDAQGDSYEKPVRA